MSALPEQISEDETQLEAATDQAIAACGGDLRSTIRALILANDFFAARTRGESFKRIRARHTSRVVISRERLLGHYE